MSCSRKWLAAALLLAACSRAPHPVERVAILTFENLTGDPSLDWMGRALPELAAGALASSARTHAIPLDAVRRLDAASGVRPAGIPGVSAERAAALAAGAGQLVYGTFSQGGVQAFIEDAATGRIGRAIAAGGDPFSAAAALAVALDPAARPAAIRDAAAMREYVGALDSGDEGAAARATQREPRFGPAWLVRAQLALRHRGVAAALPILEAAAAQPLAAAEKAQVAYSLALLRGDTPGRRRSLVELTRLTPADPAPYRTLAEIALHGRQYGEAAGHLRSAASLYRADPTVWNSLGYARAYSGDLRGAVEALQRYRELRPRDANPLDSLGDVHLYLGRLPEAESFYLEASRRDPRFLDGGDLLKAAWARLLSGDVAAATRTFDLYMNARRADPLGDYRRAEWAWLSGRRREAVETLAAAVPPQPELAARAHSQLAIWRLQQGDAAGARQAADRAMALAPTLALAQVASFLAQPPAPASEWAARAERTLPAGPMKEYALACALLLSRQFQAAVPVLRQIYAGWNPSADPGTPILLAWAYAETGRARDAAALVQANPIPQASGLNPFTGLWFPRLAQLRGNQKLFMALSGDTP